MVWGLCEMGFQWCWGNGRFFFFFFENVENVGLMVDGFRFDVKWVCIDVGVVIRFFFFFFETVGVMVGGLRFIWNGFSEISGKARWFEVHVEWVFRYVRVLLGFI